MHIVPIVTSWSMWTFLFVEGVVWLRYVSLSFMLAFEIFYLCILDKKREFKYKRATFYFYDDTEISDIVTESIIQKRNWIVAHTIKEKREYRFRVKDIKYIAYDKEPEEV